MSIKNLSVPRILLNTHQIFTNYTENSVVGKAYSSSKGGLMCIYRLPFSRITNLVITNYQVCNLHTCIVTSNTLLQRIIPVTVHHHIACQSTVSNCKNLSCYLTTSHLQLHTQRCSTSEKFNVSMNYVIYKYCKYNL